MKITNENQAAVYKDLKEFYLEEINKAVIEAGSPENLSILLKKSRTYARMVMTRNPSLDRLKDLFEEIQKGY